ncbi:MAG: hypothetical protein HYY84_05220 [Deltaproteobacteria bacterium]|nr:hypothetical protein [Deltaproteobacteria bacterium]
MRRAIAGLCGALVFASTSASAFDPHEHKNAGDEGAARAFPKAPEKLRSPWRNKAGRNLVRPGAGPGGGPLIWTSTDAKNGAWVSFGALCAIYGDLRKTVNDLTDAPDSNWKRLVEITEKKGKSIDDFFNDEPEQKRFFELAAVNKTHFHRVAVETYRDAHRAALALVADAAQDGDLEKLWRALHSEALGCHSLTDLFAVGHMMIDRESAVKLSTFQAGVNSILDAAIGKVAGAAGKAWSGGQGFTHNGYNFWGATVKNTAAPGAEWKAFGDAKYGQAMQVEYMKRAVHESIKTLLNAYGEFAAAPSRTANALKRLQNDGRSYVALSYVPVQFRSACTVDWPSFTNIDTFVTNALVANGFVSGDKEKAWKRLPKVCSPKSWKSVGHRNFVRGILNARP